MRRMSALRLAHSAATLRRLLAAASALVLLAMGAPQPSAAASARQCRYVRLGSMPATWVGSRLRVQGSVDDTPEPMILDSGAVHMLIPVQMAADLALVPIPGVRGSAYGAGGKTWMWVAKVMEIQVGDVKGSDVKVAVASVDSLDILVGADFLFQHDLELDGGRATSFTPLDCGDVPLAWWAADVPYVPIEEPDGDDRRVVVEVRVNGHPLRALVDTGAPTTVIDAGAAHRLGLGDAADGTGSRELGGVGNKRMRVWPVAIDDFALGGEQVTHTRLLVGDLWGNQRQDMGTLTGWWRLRHAPEVILGADFLRAHHLLFAMQQRRLYFSYQGGDLFNTPTEAGVPEPAASSGG